MTRIPPLTVLFAVVLLLAGCATGGKGRGGPPKAAAASVPVGLLVPSSFEREVRLQVGGKYLVYLPTGYDERQGAEWPLLLFLHGSGERGDDLELVKKHGPPMLVAQGRRLPFIVVAPQCPPGTWWSVDVLGALLDEVQERYRVDRSRVYCTGLSMGGYGTWAMVAAYPRRFAAIAPVCGGGEPMTARRLKDTPTWVFHGDQDEAVPLAESERMVAALKEVGGLVKFTVYPGVGHDSWVKAYDDPELYGWLLSFRRTDASPERVR